MTEITITPGTGSPVFTSVLAADATTLDTGANVIPARGNVLRVFAVLRTDQAVVDSSGAITFNGDGGAHYDSTDVQVLNTTVAGSTNLAQTGVTFDCAGASAAAGVVSLLDITIPAFALTTFNKTGVYHVSLPSQTAASALYQARGFAWRSTAAITQVTLSITSGAGQKFKAGSAIYVYTQ